MRRSGLRPQATARIQPLGSNILWPWLNPDRIYFRLRFEYKIDKCSKGPSGNSLSLGLGCELDVETRHAVVAIHFIVELPCKTNLIVSNDKMVAEWIGIQQR